MPVMGMGQTTRFAVNDSIPLTTTPATKIYATPLDCAILTPLGCDMMLEYTISTQDAFILPWFRVTDNSSFMITRNMDLGIPGLKSVRVRSVSGTGILYVTGVCKVDF